MLPVFLAALLYISATSFAEAGVKISERTKYYSVKGKTGVQLFGSILKKGPRKSKKGHAIATTLSQLKIGKVRYKTKGKRCRAAPVTVRLKLTYTYPRWRNSRKASKRMRSSWNKFYARLQRHEKTHGRYSKDFAREVERIIRRTTGSSRKRCRDAIAKAKRQIKRAEKKWRRRHAEFDRRESKARSRIRRLQVSLMKSR